MTSATASAPTISSPSRALESLDSINSTFTFPAPANGHTRSQSTFMHSKSSNNITFPRRPPSTSNLGNQARPRSSISDASTLLAEIGLPAPVGVPDSSKPRNAPVLHFPEGNHPQSLTTAPTPFSLAVAPAASTRIGHRRGASELIGGEKLFDMSKGESEGDKKLPQPGAPIPRRGHAHRRSAAISSGDILGLLSQSSPSLPLPSSLEKENKESTESKNKDGADVRNSPVASSSAPASPDAAHISSPLPPLPVVPPLDSNCCLRRSAKVAFMDRVEIIPRPLSTSTIGSGLTVRANHSGTDSISSFSSSVSPMSNNPSIVSVSRSPTRSRSNSISTQTNPLPPEVLQEITQRPSTAGANLSSPQSRPQPNELLPPLSTDLHFLNPPSSVSDDSSKRKLSNKKHKKALSDSSPHTSPLRENAEKSDDKTSPTLKSRKSKRDKRKKKQIKLWLGARVLGKNGKNRNGISPSEGDNTADWKFEDATPGWATSYVLMPEGSMAGRSLEELSSTMSPRLSSNFGTGNSPVIDLDAALAPLNNPSPSLGGRPTGFSAAKRTMHSSGAGGRLSIGNGIGSGIGGGAFGASFIGCHRRSESMPEMPLFTLSEEDRMTMEDVFEEDEDEDEEDTDSDESEDETSNETGNTEGFGIGINTTSAEDERTESGKALSLPAPVVCSGSGRRSSLAPSLSKGSLTNESIIEEDEMEENVPEVRQAVTPCTSLDKLRQISESSPSSRCATPTSTHQSVQSITTQSSASTVTASNPLASSPQVETFGSRTRSSSCATSTFTGLESPSAPSTPNLGPLTSLGSSDAMPSIKRLAAEIAAQEGQFDPYADSPLHFLGEPGPEIRMSVDDVPSLTSSRSTMTSSYAAYLAAQPPPSPLREEISASLSRKSKSGKRKWIKLFKFWEGKKDRAKEKKEEKMDKNKDKSRPSTKATNSSVPSLLR